MEDAGLIKVRAQGYRFRMSLALIRPGLDAHSFSFKYHYLFLINIFIISSTSFLIFTF